MTRIRAESLLCLKQQLAGVFLAEPEKIVGDGFFENDLPRHPAIDSRPDQNSGQSERVQD